MKKMTYGMLGMLLLAGVAVGQSKRAAGGDVAAELKALEEKWTQAQLKGDVAALDALLADDLITTTNEGELRTKADSLSSLKSGALKFQTSKVDDMRVSVYGDTAVVVGRWQGKGTDRGKAFDDVERFTDTWVKQNGQWRCVASQSTLIKKK